MQYLDDDQRKLYDLIWKRTIASQMQSAELDKTSADIVDGDGKVTLRANGSIIVFDGFLSVYREDKDDNGDQGDQSDPSENDENRLLPPLAGGEPLDTVATLPDRKSTSELQSPPYTSYAILCLKKKN